MKLLALKRTKNSFIFLIVAGFVSTLISCQKSGESGGTVVSSANPEGEQVTVVWDNNDNQQSQNLVNQINGIIAIGGGGGGGVNNGTAAAAGGGIVATCGLPNLNISNGNNPFIGCTYDQLYQAFMDLYGNNGGSCSAQFISQLSAMYQGIHQALTSTPSMCGNMANDWLNFLDEINSYIKKCGGTQMSLGPVCGVNGAGSNPGNNGGNVGGGSGNANPNGGSNPPPTTQQFNCERAVAVYKYGPSASPGNQGSPSGFPNITCLDALKNFAQNTGVQPIVSQICTPSSLPSLQALNVIINNFQNGLTGNVPPYEKCEFYCTKASLIILNGLAPGQCIP
ncbi:MAG: hypothetical protein QE271_09930 [Bacteriovoracaceae bacterium]|nr:hypothetical protein [Bacteriovoracaceae bacterium]